MKMKMKMKTMRCSGLGRLERLERLCKRTWGRDGGGDAVGVCVSVGVCATERADLDRREGKGEVLGVGG